MSHHGALGVPWQTTQESTLMSSVSAMSSTTYILLVIRQVFCYFADVLDWVKSSTGFEDGYPKEVCYSGGSSFNAASLATVILMGLRLISLAVLPFISI